MDYENLIVEKSTPVAVVTVNRPKVLNALNRKTVEELECAFYDIGAEPKVKVVILTGAGEKSFIAGADISEFDKFGSDDAVRFAHKGQEVLNRIEDLGKPVIAAINGYALGGGLEIAMACHLRIASVKALLGQPEIDLGLIPGFGGTQRLSRLVGEGWAMELVLTGDKISAEQGLRIGLLNQVVPPQELMDAAKAMADKLLGKSAVSLRYAMEAVHHGLQVPLQEGLNLEANLFGLCCATEDKKEGVRAFMEKRKPKFLDK
jgi:enoyl-CoA hydratase